METRNSKMLSSVSAPARVTDEPLAANTSGSGTIVMGTAWLGAADASTMAAAIHPNVDRFIREPSFGFLPPDQCPPISSALRCKYGAGASDRKSTRLNSSHLGISYAVFCLKKKKK